MKLPVKQVSLASLLVRIIMYYCVYTVLYGTPNKGVDRSDCASFSTFGCREPVACCPDALSCLPWRMTKDASPEKLLECI